LNPTDGPHTPLEKKQPGKKSHRVSIKELQDPSVARAPQHGGSATIGKGKRLKRRSFITVGREKRIKGMGENENDLLKEKKSFTSKTSSI